MSPWRTLTMPFRSRRSYVAYVDYEPHGSLITDDLGNEYRVHAPRWWQARARLRWWRLPKAEKALLTIQGGFVGGPRALRVVRVRPAPVHVADVPRRSPHAFRT